jgi:hypothetical protein
MREAEARAAAAPVVPRYKDGSAKDPLVRAAESTDVEHARDSQKFFESQDGRAAQILLADALARQKAEQLERAKTVGKEFDVDPASALRAERNARITREIEQLEQQRPIEPDAEKA